MLFRSRILAIFPEEARFYASRGARVTWVGHPLIDTVATLPDRQQARQRLRLPEAAPVLLLLPASRPQELRYLLPAMLEAAVALQRRQPNLEVVIPAALEGFQATLEEAIHTAGLRARLIPAAQADGLKADLCAAADAAVTKSGTANLELALRGVPQVTGYRVSRATALVAQHLLRFSVPHISPVNLVLNERLVPELLQDAFNSDAIVAAVEPLLQPGSHERQAMLEGYGRLRLALGEPGVTRRAAAAILDQIPTSSQPCAD